jgi:hypothetical protein
MYTVGSWFVYLMNGAILAILAVIALVAILVKRDQYAKEARNAVLCELWIPGGRPYQKLAHPTPDGWVRLGRAGDYKLAVARRLCTCGHDENEHGLAENKATRQVGRGKCQHVGCECTQFEEGRVIPAIRRWGLYPIRPFLGLKTLQVDVRQESWWLNDPTPITPPDNRTTVTAIDAQFHTREQVAAEGAVEIQEQEGRQRAFVEAMQKMPDKMLLYILVGISIAVGLFGLIQSFGG